MAESSKLAFLYGAFQPPFKGLLVIVWLFFAWAFLVHPDSPLLAGKFYDSDDYIHFVRVIDWLEGQSWFDPVLYRLAPPEGTSIHYSRIAELPLAAIMAPLHAVGFTWQAAAYAAAAVYPLALFGLFLLSVVWAAKAAVPENWARASAFVTLFAPSVTFPFSVGRVDHHGFALLLTIVAFGCLLRLMREPEKLKWGIGAGFCLAFGLGVALETLPWLLVFAAIVGMSVVFGGKRFAAASIGFALSLYVFSALFLAASVAPAVYYVMDPLAFSYLYVYLNALIAFVIIVTSGIAFAAPLMVRFGIGAALAVCAGFVFLSDHPALLAGPYGGMNAQLATLFFANIAEAVPALRATWSFAELIIFALWPLLALAASFRLMMQAGKSEEVWRWLAVFVMILCAFVLTFFYQLRVGAYLQLFCIVPLTAFLARGWGHIAKTKQGRARFAAEIGLILLVGLLTVFAPAAADGRSFGRGVLLFPAQKSSMPPDMNSGLWQTLNLPTYYGDKPRVILSMINDGAAILFHTKHLALSAPYHRNVKGNLEAYAFFSASDLESAEQIARRAGVDLVLITKEVPAIYRKAPHTTKVDANGELMADPSASLAVQLAKKKVPDWLKPVEVPFMPDYLLFEVKK